MGFLIAYICTPTWSTAKGHKWQEIESYLSFDESINIEVNAPTIV